AVLGGLFGGRGSVVGWADLEDVGDVDAAWSLGGSVEVHRGDHLGEFLSGASDEGDARGVFVGSGGFTDEHDRGVGGAVGEDDLVPAGHVLRDDAFAFVAFAEFGEAFNFG